VEEAEEEELEEEVEEEEEDEHEEEHEEEEAEEEKEKTGGGGEVIGFDDVILLTCSIAKKPLVFTQG